MNHPKTSPIHLTLEKVCVNNLRCHPSYEWKCEPGVNIMVGSNGSGKTSLLESIYIMAHGRSFRQARDPKLVRHGESHFSIRGEWRRFGPMHVSASGRKGRTEISLQGRVIHQRRDLRHSLPVLVNAPQGRRLIEGVPGERRRWLDQLVMDCQEPMVDCYERYMRSIMQRSRLLRRRCNREELDGWEHQIVHHGERIVAARQHLLMQLNDELQQEKTLTESLLKLQMGLTVQVDKDTWIQQLSANRDKDIKVGSLRIGPHCDRVDIFHHDREIRHAGSRGQQKLAAIALLLAECRVRADSRNLLPLLLFDDCLESLDRQRQHRLLQRLVSIDSQVLITAPDGIMLPSNLNISIHELDHEPSHAVMEMSKR
ncbi:MAG: DNA replication and repair protein RecF [Mariprofundaceae bacterium]